MKPTPVPPFAIFCFHRTSSLLRWKPPP